MAASLPAGRSDNAPERRPGEAQPVVEPVSRQIIDAIGDAIFLHDEAGRVLDVNDRMCLMFRCDRATALSLSVNDLSLGEPPFSEREAQDLVGRALAEGPQVFEWRSRRVTGELFWSEVALRACEIAGRRRVIASVRDITGRKADEEALRRSEERFRVYFENSLLAMAITSPGKAWVEVNDPLCRLLGYPREVLLATTWDELTHPEDRERDVAQYERMLAGEIESYALEKRFLRADGRVVDTIMSARVVRRPDRGPDCCLVQFQDITERIQAERGLRENERRLSLAISATSDAIWEWNLATGETYYSPRWYEMLGYGDRRFPMTFDAWRGLCHPDDFQPTVDRIQAFLASPAGTGYEAEFRMRARNGSWIWILGRGNVVERDAAGRPALLSGTNTDITERKRAEEERLELERRLLHAQKLESLGLLAGGIAHDFNNLLMAILGNLDLTLAALPSSSPARAGIEHAIQATRRASDLTRQMLAYSGKGRFVVATVDLNELVRENAGLFRSAVARTTTLSLALCPGACPVEADPGQVQQIVMNLITNAAEAIGGRPGLIVVATGIDDFDETYLSRSRLDVRPAPGRMAFLEVADTGCGMDEGVRQRLFDPFFTTKFTGRGLGMSVVLGIVRGHGGAILVDSAAGRGTTIRVLLPAGEEERPARVQGDGAGQAEPHAASRMILVVDDEAAVRELCLEFIGLLGYQGLGAADGEEALALFRGHAGEIACVLLDLTMPRMDGVAAFEEMRRIRPDVPVILSSGYNEQEAIQRFTGEGLAGFIQKPYRLQELREKVARAVRPAAEAWRPLARPDSGR